MFEVAASYDRYMGRFSSGLAPGIADLAGVVPERHVLDVGCGPGALTGELVARVGPSRVVAVDPSAPFGEALRSRYPGVVVLVAAAERLPLEDDRFDVALAQLVVHFMEDPVAGLCEMARVTRSGGSVAASVWDFGGDRSPVSPFWRAARAVDPSAPGESALPGAHAGHLRRLFADAGLVNITDAELTVTADMSGFDDWWEPFEFGVGPGGAYLSGLTDATRVAVKERCRAEVPEGPFTLEATAWATTGTVR